MRILILDKQLNIKDMELIKTACQNNVLLSFSRTKSLCCCMLKEQKSSCPYM
jgi:hypothetical protein